MDRSLVGYCARFSVQTPTYWQATARNAALLVPPAPHLPPHRCQPTPHPLPNRSGPLLLTILPRKQVPEKPRITIPALCESVAASQGRIDDFANYDSLASGATG